jgi:hypothetical protein
MSEIGNQEYWPETVFDQVGASPQVPNMGCAIPLSPNNAEQITGIISEIGTFITTGTVGSDLLVFLQNRAVRLTGTTVADFQIVEGASEGCAVPATIQRCGDVMIWFDGEHVRQMSLGGTTSKIVSYQLWPQGFSGELTSAQDRDSISGLWSSVYKDGWYYLLAAELPSTVNNVVYALHVASGTWLSIPGPYSDICLANIQGAKSEPRLVGASLLVDSSTHVGDLYDLFGLAPSGAVNRISEPLLAGKDDHLNKLKHVKTIKACLSTPATNPQSVTLSLYANGDMSTAVESDTPTLGLNPQVAGYGSAAPGYQIIEWTPPAYDAVILQLGISATLSERISIEWIYIEIEVN